MTAENEHVERQTDAHDGLIILFLFANMQKQAIKNFTFVTCKISVKDSLQCYASVMLSVEIKNATFPSIRNKLVKQK